ncbi:MAG TPA: prepilin-type N-terminal cleavage/methylation domain-containing protein [Geothrix sp.]|jgi:prepilin-type N-terminal cleavage/methylation domain-containing protein
MKNQKGFTLIELLLVLAIIGIISAIAIPALLSQRARARDKASMSNLNGRIGDLIGQYDRNKEAGVTKAAMLTALNDYLVATAKQDKSPWDNAAQAFGVMTEADATDTTTVDTVVTDIGTIAAAGPKGQVAFKLWHPQEGAPAIPAAGGNPAVPAKLPASGYMAGGVKIDNLINGSNIVTKVSALE